MSTFEELDEAVEDLREALAVAVRRRAEAAKRSDLNRCADCGCVDVVDELTTSLNFEVFGDWRGVYFCSACQDEVSILVEGTEDPATFEREHDDENCTEPLCAKIPGVQARRDARAIKEAR